MLRWVLVVAAVGCTAVAAREAWESVGELRDPQGAWERRGLHKATGSMSPSADWIRRRRVSRVLDLVAAASLVVVGGWALVTAVR
jgi:hypothetical protein